MNTKAWETLLATRYATPNVPTSMAQGKHTGSELDMLFGIGCVRFHRRRSIKYPHSILYTYIPMRLMPMHKGAGEDEEERVISGCGTMAAQLVRMAAATVGTYSAQTVVLDLQGMVEYSSIRKQRRAEEEEEQEERRTWESEEVAYNKRKYQTFTECLCTHVYEAIRSMHATLDRTWRTFADKLRTVYILGSDGKSSHVYTTAIVHQLTSKEFLTMHRMFALSAETDTGESLYKVIEAVQTIPASSCWASCVNSSSSSVSSGSLDMHTINGAMLRMVTAIEDSILGASTRDAGGNRAVIRTAIRSIILEQSLRVSMAKESGTSFNLENHEENDTTHKEQKNILKTPKEVLNVQDKPTFESLLLARLIMDPNYMPHIADAQDVHGSRDAISLKHVLGSFSIAAHAQQQSEKSQQTDSALYSNSSSLGVLTSISRMAVILTKCDVNEVLCSAFLNIPLSTIKDIVKGETPLATPKDIGTVGIASAGILTADSEAAGISGARTYHQHRN